VQEEQTTAEDEISSFLEENDTFDDILGDESEPIADPSPEPESEPLPEAAGDPAPATPEPIAPSLDDFNQYGRTLEDGRRVFDLHKLPEDALLAYGDDLEKDMFTRKEGDWRRSTTDRERTQLKDTMSKLGGDPYLEDGRSKVQMYDEMQTQLHTQADAFVERIAENVADPIRTAWSIISKYGGKDVEEALKPAFDGLIQNRLYDQSRGQQVQNDRQLEHIEQQRAQLAFDTASAQARNHVETSLVGHRIDDQTWGQMQQEFQGRLKAHQASPDYVPAPTFEGIWGNISGGQPEPIATPVPPSAPLTPPRTERPRGASNTAARRKASTSEDEIDAWLSEKDDYL